MHVYKYIGVTKVAAHPISLSKSLSANYISAAGQSATFSNAFFTTRVFVSLRNTVRCYFRGRLVSVRCGCCHSSLFICFSTMTWAIWRWPFLFRQYWFKIKNNIHIVRCFLVQLYMHIAHLEMLPLLLIFLKFCTSGNRYQFLIQAIKYIHMYVRFIYIYT